MKGVLATDLDGTVAVKGIIGRQERQAAQELRNLGIKILMVTGRNAHSLQNVEGIWDIADEILFSSGAGWLSSPHARPVELSRLHQNDVGIITQKLDEAHEDYCVLQPVPQAQSFAWKRHRLQGRNPDFDARMNQYSLWNQGEYSKPFPACQILVIRPFQSSPFPQDFFQDYSVFSSRSPLDHSSQWIEIFPKGRNKGTAFAQWCHHAKVQRHQTGAVGNDENDGAMLQWAARSWVVANAPPILLAHHEEVPPAGQGGFPEAAQRMKEWVLSEFG
ncbi:MAG: Cof-type HAD-IIB family hydrolase [Spirochaetales bacterium]|nr:Cof-type HAD-IIB family hydrolase [Spirochaetales bacterium]